MGAHVLWLGPVSREQRSGATVAGADEHFIACTGDGSGGFPRCRAFLEGLADQEGRHLPRLLAHLGVAEGEELYVGAFSAGGSAVKILLAHPQDRAAIRAVMLADATYELAGADGRPGDSPALVAYATEAGDGSRMFVATASSAPNNTQGTEQPSGSQTLERLAHDIEVRAGQPFDQPSGIEGLDDVQPVKVWRRGTVVLADLGNQFKHAEHATVVAAKVWRQLLQPWVEGRPLESPQAVGAAAPSDNTPAAPAPRTAPLWALTLGALGIGLLGLISPRRLGRR